MAGNGIEITGSGSLELGDGAVLYPGIPTGAVAILDYVAVRFPALYVDLEPVGPGLLTVLGGTFSMGAEASVAIIARAPFPANHSRLVLTGTARLNGYLDLGLPAHSSRC